MLLRILADHCVSHTSEADLTTLVRLVREVDRTPSTQDLCEVLSRMGVARAGTPAPPDVEVGHGQGAACREKIDSAYALTETKACVKVVGATYGSRVGQKRESIYKECLRPLAMRAHRAVIYDRYCAENLRNNGQASGTAWLINRLLADGIPQIEVLTTCRSSGDAATIRGLASGLFSPDVRFRLGPQSVASHDRHIRFQFGVNRAAIAVGIAAGIGNVFGRDVASEVFDIYQIRAGRARDREVDLAKAADRWEAP